MVLGATGRTGREVLSQALDRGHRVVGLARRPDAISVAHPRLEVVQGDVLDPGTLPAALRGVDAVVSALGVGRSRQPVRVYSEGIRNVLSPMQSAGVERIVVVSAEPAGPWAGQPRLRRMLVFPLLQRLFGTSYDDMRRMETVLRDSSANWTVLRPPRLVAKPPKRSYRLNASGPLRRASSLTYADLAAALLDALDQPALTRKAVAVAN